MIDTFGHSCQCCHLHFMMGMGHFHFIDGIYIDICILGTFSLCFVLFHSFMDSIHCSYSTTNKMRLFLKLSILVKCSACFGRSFCP